MFSCFNLTINKDFLGNDYHWLTAYAEEIGYKEQIAKEDIRKIIKSDSISASQLSEEWFPQVKADVFISHSSKDKKLAYALAGWLFYHFGIVSFIDSIFWNYSGDLLEEINEEYSEKRKKTNGGYLYSHQKCNKASEHVNIMLNAALQKMIDKTEAVFFLNTDNSIRVFNRYDHEIPETYSPWIFSEILCTQIVRKKPLREYRKNYDIPSFVFEHAASGEVIGKRALEISYEVSLSHLEDISGSKLKEWCNMDDSKFFGYPLDGLYSLSSNYSEELRNTRILVAAEKCLDKSELLFE